jgi:hypothetical protein
VGFSWSFYEFARGVLSWQLVSSVAIIALVAVSQRIWGLRVEFRRVGLVIGTYAACQVAFYMTNFGGPNMWLAPAALASLAAVNGGKQSAQQAGILEVWRMRVASSRLVEIFAKEALPLVMFLFVLIPQIVSSISAAKFAALVSLGIEKPYVMTAGKGISVATISYLKSGPGSEISRWNDAVAAISSLKLEDRAIANIDYANSFPVLFLAPPPKGVHVFFQFRMNIPEGAQLQWSSVTHAS